MSDVTGLAFPFRINGTGGLAMASGADKLRQNIRTIIATRFGELPMLRGYGTRIHSLVHDPNDDALTVLVRKQLQESLLAWEPRVLITNISFEQSADSLSVRLDYTFTDQTVTDSL